MKHLIIGILLFGVLHMGNLKAQDQVEERQAHIGLLYPLSTNGLAAPIISNRFSLHLFGGVSAGESGLCLSGYGHITRGSLRGAQISGFGNVITASSKGVVWGGFGNVVHDIEGVLVGGFGNISDATTGLQLGGFGNVAGQMIGAQIGGFGNVKGNGKGVQAAGFGNISKKHTGIQAAGFGNISGRIDGYQTAGFINIADEVHGLQVAGFINIADKVHGIQAAGFINIADSSDYPIGIINIINNGQMYLQGSIDELGTTLVSFRSGGKYTYGFIGVGTNSQLDGNFYWASHAGLGMQFRLRPSLSFRGELELANVQRGSELGQISKQTFRALVNANWKPIHFFAGPGISFVQANRTPVSSPFFIAETFRDNNWYYLGIALTGGIAIRIK
jgi:hypothetical protein